MSSQIMKTVSLVAVAVTFGLVSSPAHGDSGQAGTGPSTGIDVRAKCQLNNAYPLISQRRAISCRKAKRVYTGARKASRLPKPCKVGQTKRWNGWTIRAVGGFEELRFKKGTKSFVAGGGGRC